MPPPPICKASSESEILCTHCFTEKVVSASSHGQDINFTLEESVVLLAQSAFLRGQISTICEDGKNLNAVLKRFEKLDVPDPNPSSFTFEDPAIWGKKFDEKGRLLDMCSPVETYLRVWLAIYKPVDSHPLDGEMDLNFDYGSKVDYIMGIPDFQHPYRSTDEIKQSAKCYLFHIMATLGKLETSKAARKDVRLDYDEVCSLMLVMSRTRQNRPETVPTATPSKVPPLLSAGEKLRFVVPANKGTTLTRAEVLQVLKFCQDIVRPKFGSGGKAADIAGINARHSTGPWSEQYHHTDTNVLAFIKSIEAFYIVKMDAVKHVMGVADDQAISLQVAKEEGNGASLSVRGALELLITCCVLFKYGKTDLATRFSDAKHPQVRACSRMIASQNTNLICLLDNDEVRSLNTLFEELPAFKDKVAQEDGTFSAESPLPTKVGHNPASPAEKQIPAGIMQFFEHSEVGNMRHLVFTEDYFDLPKQSLEQMSVWLENATGVATMVGTAKDMGTGCLFPSTLALSTVIILTLVSKHGGFPLVMPSSDPMHPQVTAIDKLLRLDLKSAKTGCDYEVLLDLDEILSLDKILQHLPVVKAKFRQLDESQMVESLGVQEYAAQGSKNLADQDSRHENETRAAESSSLYGSSSEFPGEAEDPWLPNTVNAPDLTDRIPQTSTAGDSTACKSASSAATTEANKFKSNLTTSEGFHIPEFDEFDEPDEFPKYTGNELKSAIFAKLWALKENLDKHNHKPVLSQEQWEASIGTLQVDQVERGKNILEILNTEIITMFREHRDETERLKKEHNKEVDKLKQQFDVHKAQADSRYESLRDDVGHWKQKENVKTLELRAEKEKHKNVLKERDDDLKDFKEKGKKQIQYHMDRATKYKKKYDEEIASNSVMKLDFAAMAQMIEDNKAEKEHTTSKSQADELRITELEKELGGLRSKRAMPALDQRTTLELNEARRDKAILQSDVSALKKQVETFKNQLTAMEKIQEATKAELDEERAKLRNGEGTTMQYGDGLRVEWDALYAEEERAIRLEKELESLDARASLAEDDATRWYDLYLSTIDRLNDQTKELAKEEAKYIALQDKWERMKAVMDS